MTATLEPEVKKARMPQFSRSYTELVQEEVTEVELRIERVRYGTKNSPFKIPDKPQSRSKKRDPFFKVLRRLRGFLISRSGAEAKVAFVQNGETVIYYLPTERLARAGVTFPDQPFEMDEVEFRPSKGQFGKGYIFRALAKVQDAEREPLALSPELREKLSVLLKKDTDAQG